MVADERPYTFDRVVRLLLSAGVVVGLLWVARLLAPVLIPFAVALLLAYLLHPLVCLVQRRIHNRIAATLVTLFGVTVVAVTAGWVLVGMIVSEIVRFGLILQQMAEERDMVRRLSELIPAELAEEVRAFAQDWSRLLDQKVIGEWWNLLANIAPVPWDILQRLGTVIAAVLGLTVVALYLVFLLVDYDWVKSHWQRVIPEPQRPGLVRFINEFDLAMRRHFRAQALIAACVGVMMALGFWLIGLPLGVLFGFFVGATNMVPYLQLATIPLALMLALMQVAQGDAGLVWALGGSMTVYVVVQIIQDAVLVPKFLGDASGLRPAVILLALTVWGQLLGLLGLLLALPLTCLGWAWYARWVLEPACRQASGPSSSDDASEEAPPVDGGLASPSPKV